MGLELIREMPVAKREGIFLAIRGHFDMTRSDREIQNG
jgi:hypothetical protein